MVIVLFLQLLPLLAPAQKANDREPLTTAAAVRALTPDEAKAPRFIQITGVVTLSHARGSELFVQDGTSGIYVQARALPAGVRPGTRVRVTGQSRAGWFSPFVVGVTVEALGTEPLPTALPFNFSQPEARWLDAQFVQVYCLVRDVRAVKGGAGLLVEGTAGLGILAFREPVPEEDLRRRVGSVVRARGVCVPEFDPAGRVTGNVRVLLQSLNEVTAVESATPVRTIQYLRRFLPGVSPIPLVRTTGVVTGRFADDVLLVQDDTGGYTVRLRTEAPADIGPGTRVEVSGFLAWNGDRIAVRSADVTALGTAPLPEPRDIASEPDLAAADACRVRFQGRVTEASAGRLTLVRDGMTVSVRVPADWGPGAEVESVVTVTGALASRFDVSTGLIILPLAPADVVVVAPPDRPRITRGQVAVALAAGTGVALVGTVWVLALRRAVRTRTHQLRESEQKFATAFHASPDAAVLARVADGKFLEVNDGFCRLIGYSREQVLGRSVTEENWFDPESRTRVLDAARSGEIVRDQPATVRDATGRAHEVAISSIPVTVGGDRCRLDIIRDVTEQNRAERAARNEKLFTDTIIESMPGILYFYDAQGRFLRWNRNFETVSGYSAAEVAHMHPLDFFSDQDKALVAQRIAAVFETGEAFIEAPFLSKDGRTVPFYLTGRRVTFEGQACLVGIGIDVSARQAAETRLAESEREYRELVELANSIILRWNPEGRVTLLNEFGLRFFGYAAEEIVGRHVMDTIVPSTESTGRDLRDLMAHVCADPKSFEQNVNENVRKNGARAWIAWTNRIIFDAQGRVVEILSIGTDVTAQRRAEQALAASERKFAALFHMAPMALSLSTGAGELVDVNQAFTDLYGVPREHVVGRRAVDVPGLYTSPDDRAELYEVLRRDGRIRNLVRTRPRADGTPVTTIASVELIDLDGSPHVLTAIADISSQKQAQEALREANATLERRVAERTDELVAANNELEAFCYSVSHDLRAPLRSIDGFSQAVLEDYQDRLDPEGASFLRRIRAAAGRMGELIDDLLTLSQVTRADLRRERVDLSAMASEVVRALQHASPERAVDVSVAPGLGADGDRNLFRILLDNLIGNAWKYTGKTPRARIEVGCEERDGAPAFFVRDNGAGFDPAYAHKLFQPFQRLHRADEFPGHGIGLATVLRIVRRHGGTVSASGSVGTGARFWFTMTKHDSGTAL
ncbi:PAS domain S-box protein [Gemmata sp. G18]|uniref:histidine kinase n=1 Tax=Gemmata palustris TaxID=2822762 RepID=A0ABS5BU64_9BACT|nr:PAS domain S-box protein [Gemmata palustris]MBP3956413.1 PAS domain S-box protein [Gemmata palustris]